VHRLIFSFEQVVAFFLGKVFALVACIKAAPFLQVNCCVSPFLFIICIGRLIVGLSLLCHPFLFTDQDFSYLFFHFRNVLDTRRCPGVWYQTPGGNGIGNQEASCHWQGNMLIVAFILFCVTLANSFFHFFFCGCNLGAGKD